ncbi:hypothetical protein [Brucella intermedia]|nr:hypothetical protein [Brucella intermedia]
MSTLECLTGLVERCLFDFIQLLIYLNEASFLGNGELYLHDAKSLCN